MYDLLLVTNVALWAALVFHYVSQPQASVYHPASYYLFFHGLVFTFRPFLVYYRGYEGIYRAYEFIPSIEDKSTVLIAAMLGLVCFYATVMKFGTAVPRFPQDRINEAERRELTRPFLIATALLLPIGLVSALANWDTQANESSTMVLDAATGYQVNTTGNGYFDNAQLLLAPLTVLCVWLYRFKWWTFAPLVAFLILRGGTGGRWPIIMAGASIVLLYLYEKRRRWPEWRSLVFGVVTLFLFQMIGADRGTAIRRLFIEDRSSLDANVEAIAELRLMETMDFANLEFFEYLVYVVPQRSGTWGYFLNNLQVLTAPIPRVLWPDKPIGAPIKLFSLFDYGHPIGMTNSLPGEGWVQLGYLGVIIWCALFGWLFGIAYNKFQQSLHGNPALLTYLLFLPLSLTFFRDGFLLTIIQTAVFFLFPIWLIVKIARLSAVPLADEIRLLAYRRAARRSPDIAAKILARQRGAKRSVLGRID